MSYKKAIKISLLLAVFCWILSGVIASATPKIWIALFAITFSMIFLCFLTIAISKKIRPGLSPYRIFVLTDSTLGLCILGYALYDILTDTGWFAGLRGMLLLIFILPINLLLLLITFLIWKFNKRKNNNN